MSKILVDSSFLFSLFNNDDKDHEASLMITNAYHSQFLIPHVVLTEATFLFNRAGGVPAVILFLDELVNMKPQFEPVYPEDLLRVREIMAQYRRARLDFVDCCIMALSERLNVTQVCTLDHRDFSIFRPKHVSHLRILP